MHTLTRSKFLAVASLLTLIVVASPAAAVYAQHGADDSTNTSLSSNTTTEDSQVSTTATTSTEESTTTETEHTRSLSERADQLLDQKRQTGTEHSHEVRQRACERHEAVLDTRFSTLGTKAGKYLAAFNDVFTKVQAYQTAHNLSVANYDTLLADATAKQAAATAAVNALSALAGTKIDCTAADPAATVASVKTAADDARTALQVYRASLKALVNALLAAKRSATGTSSSTDTSGTSTTPSTTTSGSN